MKTVSALLFIDVVEPPPLPRFDLTKYVESLFLQEDTQQQALTTKEAGTFVGREIDKTLGISCGVPITVFHLSIKTVYVNI
jgi:hypothetical protein